MFSKTGQLAICCGCGDAGKRHATHETPTGYPIELDKQADCSTNIVADVIACEASAALKDQQRELLDGPVGTVCMNGRHRARVAGVNSSQEREGLRPAQFAKDDAIGVRPLKRSAYVQRYAWISNGSGGFVRASSPVWLLSQERTCRTSGTSSGATGDVMGCAGGSGDEVVTTYEYGPDNGSVGNNLWLRGVAVTADGQTRRTCYGYDGWGNRISETKPRAGLGVCP